MLPSPATLDLALCAAQPRLAHLQATADTTAFRLLDAEDLGVTLDRYGADLVLSLLADVEPRAPASVRAAVAAGAALAGAAAARLSPRSVYLKLRPRQANTLVDARQSGLTPPTPVFGEVPAGETLTVLEHGIRFRVELDRGLGTGLYLDQRGNRLWLRGESAGLAVLNTFAYTCGFSLAAALGGAVRTLSIDAAAAPLALATENFALNGLTDHPAHTFLRGDVLGWLPRLARRDERFDLIALAPPSYANVDGRRFSAERDWPQLLAAALAVLAPGGRVLASINHAGVGARRFHGLLQRGVALAGRKLVALTPRPAGVDFPAQRMKAAVLEVR